MLSRNSECSHGGDKVSIFVHNPRQSAEDELITGKQKTIIKT